MNQFEVLDDGTEPAINDTEVFRFSSLVPDAKLALESKNPESDEYDRLSPDRYPFNVSLLACSSKYGYYVAGTSKGFVYGSTRVLRDTIRGMEKTSTSVLEDKTVVNISQGPIHQLRITADQTEIVAAVAGGTVLVYKAKDVAEKKENAQPTRSFELGDDVLDLRPNPDEFPNLASAILNGNKCKIIDLISGETKASIPGDDITAVCWSPKGKQLTCGRESGQLDFVDENGNPKNGNIPVPDDLLANNPTPYVLGVLWIQPHVFLVIYGNSEGGEHTPYIIDRKSKITGGLQYVLLDEVTGVFTEERKPKMFMEVIPNFSDDMKFAVILAHSSSSDISVVGQDENGDWATYIPPENGIAVIPLSESSSDTFPVGLAIDFSVTESLPPYDPAESSEGVKPLPAVYYLNDEDHIGAYYCFQDTLAKNGEQYSGMVQPQDILSADTTAVPAPSKPEPQPAATEAPTEAKPAFGQEAKPAFGQETKPVFGQETKPAFGQETKPVFGQEASKTESTPGGFGASPWGSALSQKPADDAGFHSLLAGESSTPATATTGAFASAAAGGSFTSFRDLKKSTSTAPPTQTPNFGTQSSAPTFGATSFGQTPTNAPPTESFASMAKQSSAAPGKPGLFSSSSTPSFGSTSFGSTTATEGFGSTPKQSGLGAFGTANKEESSQFGTTTFGSAPASTGGFAALAKQTSSKIPLPAGAFGTKQAAPAFGSTSFGSTTTATSGAPAFGSTTAVGSGTPAFGSTTAVGSGAPAFGSTTALGSSKPAFGSTTPPASAPAFGSTTSLGSSKPAFGSTTALGSAPAFGSTTPLGSSKPAFGTTTPLGSAPAFGSTTPAFGSTTPTDKPATSDETKKLAEPTPSPSTSEKEPEVKKEELAVKSEPVKEEPQAEKNLFGISATAPKKEEEKSSFGFGGFSSALGSTEAAKPATPQTTGLFGKPSSPALQKEEPSKTSLFGSFGSQTTTSKPASSQSALSKPAATGFSFGSPATTTTPPSTTSSPLFKAPESTAKPSTPSPLAKAPTPAPEKKQEIPKLSAEVGMAREFELAYHSINQELKKLSLKQDEFEQRLQSQRKQSSAPKTLDDLDNSDLNSWRLGDSEDIKSMIQIISGDANDILPTIADLRSSLEYYEKDIEKLRTKEEVIKDMNEKEKDPQLKKELDKRPLDEEASKKWERIRTRAKEYGELLNELENKVHDAKKKSKLPSATAYDTKLPNLYSLQVAIRDIEQDLRSKQELLQEYEGQLARLRFNQIHAEAAKSARRIAFDDSESSDEEEAEEQPEKDEKEDKPYPQPVVDFTAKYLRRERFLDTLHQLQKSQQ